MLKGRRRRCELGASIMIETIQDYWCSLGFDTNYLCDLKQVVFLLGASIFSFVKAYLEEKKPDELGLGFPEV